MKTTEKEVIEVLKKYLKSNPLASLETDEKIIDLITFMKVRIKKKSQKI